MRLMLTLVVLAASPMSAAAQPAAAVDEATTVSELIVEARRATTVSDVVVQACTTPADSEAYGTRPLRPVANAEFDAPSRPKKRTSESPGARDFILRNIVAFRNGTVDSEHMSEKLAFVTRVNLAAERSWIVCRGAFKSIRFLHVSQAGYDDFEVDFAGGAIEWAVAPLDAHGVTSHWAARFYYPEPATKQFDKLLRSMERGRPDYDRLAPDPARALKARWPALQRVFATTRSPHEIVHMGREGDGSYAYKVVYGGRTLYWTVAPLNAEGKITALSYDEGA